jgi:hypothetical protein
MLAWTPSSDASCLKTSNSFSFPFCPFSFALFTLLCLEAGKMRETEKENGFFFFFVLCLVSEKNEIMGLILGIEKVMNGGSAEKKSFIEFGFS